LVLAASCREAGFSFQSVFFCRSARIHHDFVAGMKIDVDEVFLEH
jgi:hypothetical protein